MRSPRRSLPAPLASLDPGEKRAGPGWVGLRILALSSGEPGGFLAAAGCELTPSVPGRGLQRGVTRGRAAAARGGLRRTRCSLRRGAESRREHLRSLPSGGQHLAPKQLCRCAAWIRPPPAFSQGKIKPSVISFQYFFWGKKKCN